jgi:hypothetical protein
MIVSYAAPAGRRVLLADANPAIGGLGAATLTALNEIGELTGPDAVSPGGSVGVVGVVGVVGGWPAVSPETALNPNLGPPPSRPDWRRGTRS